MNMFKHTSVTFLCALLMISSSALTAASSKERRHTPRKKRQHAAPHVVRFGRSIKGGVILDMRSSSTTPYFTPKFVQQSLDVYGVQSLMKDNGRVIVGVFELQEYEDCNCRMITPEAQMRVWIKNFSEAAQLMNLARMTVYSYSPKFKTYIVGYERAFVDDEQPKHLPGLHPSFFFGE